MSLENTQDIQERSQPWSQYNLRVDSGNLSRRPARLPSSRTSPNRRLPIPLPNGAIR